MQRNTRTPSPIDPTGRRRSPLEQGLGRYREDIAQAVRGAISSPIDPGFGAGTLLNSSPAPADPMLSQRPPQPPVRPAPKQAQTPERSIFDIAGRFHDFQAGPKIARPNLAEEFIPVVGPAWSALGDLQDGNYGSAAFNAGAAVSDLLPFGYGIKAVRGAAKVTRALGTRLPKAYAVQRKMHKLGIANRGDDVHHIFELGAAGIKRNVQNWRNNPIFLKVLPREVHQRLHHRVGDLPRFNPLQRAWHGTTDWMKAGAAGIAGGVADVVENVEN